MRSGKAERLILIGLDGAMPEMVERFCKEGGTPNTANLIREGVFAEALPCPPVDTPTNWVTIVTGAWPGTHGITSFTAHFPGDPLDVGHSTVDLNSTELCNAEFLWDTAERAGKKCLVLNYICSWPPTFKEGLLIGGPSPRGHPAWTLGPSADFTTEIPEAKIVPGMEHVRFGIRLRWGSQDKGVPSSHSRPLEVKIPGNFTGGGFIAAPWQWKRNREETGRKPVWRPSQHLLVVDPEGSGYDRVLIHRNKASGEILAELRVDEWSDWIYDTFQVGEVTVEGAFKFRLNTLSRDGRKLELHRTVVYKTSGWTYPDSLADEIVANVGPYAGGFEAYFGEREPMGPQSPRYVKFYYEHVKQQADYLADVASYVKQTRDWDVLITQIHVQDEICHQMGFDGIDSGSPTYDAGLAEEHWQIIRNIYELTDYMIGRIVNECSDSKTLVVVLSDHAAIPIRKTVPINTILIQAGLLAVKKDGKTGAGIIDWSKTKAYNRPGFPACYIWINLKGRDPQGVVAPGKEYDVVCDQVITTLYGIRDPETGFCPISLALRKEDANMLGHWGDRASDILYFFKPGYTRGGGEIPPRGLRLSKQEVEMLITMRPGHGTHSGYLPTAKLGPCSNAAFFVMSGPGVKKGYRRPNPIWLVDVAPTLSYLLDIPPPAQSEGTVIYDLLTDTS